MARRCGVCGFESEGAVCPRCNTILLRGQAICPVCGKLFPGWIAVCDACGTALPREPEGPDDEEAVRLLASVPGISETRAKALVAKGFRDFSDIVRLALPDAAVRMGLHHAIARRALLADLSAGKTGRAASGDCPVCGAAWPREQDRCPVCGSSAELRFPVEAMGKDLEHVADGLAALGEDEDVEDLPADVRRDLVDAVGTIDPNDLVREEYRRQIEAWRSKGFVVAPLEDLLATDLNAFRERSVRLIRLQLRKKREGGTFRCPLCESSLAPEAESCANCGARFNGGVHNPK